MSMPCLNRPCRSPIECAALGFCRELSLGQVMATTPELVAQRELDAIAGATVDTQIPVLLDGRPGVIVDYENDHGGSFAIIELDGGPTKSIRLPDRGGRIVRREKGVPE